MDLKSVATQSLSIAQRGEYQYEGKAVKIGVGRIRSGVSGTRMIREITATATTSASASASTIWVMQGDSFDAAKWLIDFQRCQSPLVLDFASDSNPGGGYKSGQRGTQEESLCRRSSLPLCLEHLSSNYPIPALGAIYCPDVAVFRECDAKNYALMPSPFWVSVVAAALRSVDCGDRKNLMFVKEKVKGIMTIARENGHDGVVLGAWGCGAFGNDVEQIAECFKEAIVTSSIRCVVLAIPGGDNLNAFRKVFRDCEFVKLTNNQQQQQEKGKGKSHHAAAASH